VIEKRYSDLITTSKQIIDVAARYGILGTLGVDYTAQLMQMRADLAADNSTHYVINLPGGHIKYDNNRWLFGIKSFTLEGNNATLYPCLTPEKAAEGLQKGIDDNMLGRTFFNGELLQTNTLDYGGTKTYFNCPKIFTAEAGSNTIIAQNPAEIADTSTYYVGARLTVASKETVFDGYPWGTRNFENINYIKGINYSTGEITLRYVLKYQHTVNNPDCPASSGGGSGIGRIIPLDNPANVYTEYAEFKNLSSVPFSVRTSESFCFIANKVIIRNCVFPKLVTPSETLLGFEAYDSKFGGGEFDKLVGDVYYENVDNTGYFLSNGGGCRSVTIEGGSILNSFQPNSPFIKLRNLTLVSNNFPTVADVALQAYPGYQPVYQYEIENLKFVGTPASQTDSCINVEHLLEYTIQLVEDDGTIVVPFDGSPSAIGLKMWKSLDVGYSIWKKEGDKGGVVQSIEFDSSYNVNGAIGAFRVKGTWNKARADEVWNWSYIKNFVDKGGHTILSTNKELYYKESYMLIGREGNSKSRKIVISSESLKPNKFTYFELHAFVTGIELIVNSPMPSGRLSVNTNVNPSDNIPPATPVNFSLTTTQKRKFDEYGAYGLEAIAAGIEPDLNQYQVGAAGQWANTFGVYCGNADKLGSFSLVVSIRNY
jgi:hypothetical protein